MNGKYHIDELRVDPAMTLIVVQALDVVTTTTATGGYAYGYISPVAVVARGRDGTTAWDMQAKPASVKSLRRDIPELDAFLLRETND